MLVLLYVHTSYSRNPITAIFDQYKMVFLDQSQFQEPRINLSGSAAAAAVCCHLSFHNIKGCLLSICIYIYSIYIKRRFLTVNTSPPGRRSPFVVLLSVYEEEEDEEKAYWKQNTSVTTQPKNKNATHSYYYQRPQPRPQTTSEHDRNNPISTSRSRPTPRSKTDYGNTTPSLEEMKNRYIITTAN